VTGAGISASAGIATYRDGGSSWRDEDLEKKSHATRYGNHLDELWDKHWGPVQAQMMVAQPTAAHKAIAEFQKNHPSIIATQNIDTLHEKAGSDNVAHVHGEMTPKCMRCGSKNIHAWVGVGAPNCADCNSRKTRPDVVLFGEDLNRRMFTGLTGYALNAKYIVVIGSSLIVQPISGLVMDQLSTDKTTILINKGHVPLSKWFTEVYDTDADSVTATVLEGIDRELTNGR
jgi:NAD-dependent deacetylase